MASLVARKTGFISLLMLFCLLLAASLTGCTSPLKNPAATFTLGSAVASLSVTQSSSATSQITVTDENGFSGSVGLTASGLPAGVTASFSPASTTGSSTLTLTASATATAGTSTVTINGTSGSLSAKTTILVTVNAASTATITSFTASPATITSGSSSGLTGVFANGTGAITPGNISVTSGTAVSVSPTATTTYTLTVTPATGAAVTKTVTVSVTSSTPAPTVTITANPTPIASGGSSTLTWSSTNATSCTASGGWTGTEPTSGTKSVSPTSTTAYSLTCTGAGGTSSPASATVTVNAVVSTCSSLNATATWENITPKQLKMSQWVTPYSGACPGAAGCQSLADVLAGYSGPIATYGAHYHAIDPSNPGTVYLGTSSLGIWKTTDCGADWTHINTGNNGPALDAGRNWTIAIDPTNSQVLYTTAGYSGGGVWRSKDGGVNWEEILHDGQAGTYAGSTVPYLNTGTGGFIEKITLDPTNHNHLLVSFHAECTGTPLPGAPTDGSGGWGCMAQTFNAYAGVAPSDTNAPSWSLTTNGHTWTGTDGPGQTMLNATTWFWGTNGYNGLWRTTTGGVSPDGVSSAWTEVIPNTVGVMGGVYHASDGSLYSDGGLWGSLFHSTNSADLGDVNQWVTVTNPNTPFLSTDAGSFNGSIPYADDGTTLYISSCGNPAYFSAPLASPDSIAQMSASIPSAMTAGGCALDFDSTNKVLYSSNMVGGMWRLVTQSSTTVQPPTITSFTANPVTIASGSSSNLTAVFANGTGVITPGNIPVTSGVAASVSPTATTTYTLTVTPSSGTAITQTVVVTVTSGSGTTITDALGKPDRILIGLGSIPEPNYAAYLQQQGVAANIVQNPDIVDQYLPDFGYTSSTPSYWINYNSPPGSYVLDVAQDADNVGAVPMFTLYQMAQAGDGNISWINTKSQMDIYWSHVRILFQEIHQFGKPTLVNLEPDFWGYVELQAPGGDPRQMAASVNDQAECAALPNNVTGIAACLLAMGHTYAPNALIGFQPSFFGETAPQLAGFMNLVGAQNGDFTVAETLDRDAGCYEEALIQTTDTGNIHAATTCTRTGTYYLDESNLTTPNFNQEISQWATYRNDLATKLPVIWWQTPLGVPSSTPGGTDGHYRDDHVDYMFKNMSQYADMGTFGIVFSGGAGYQTDITTDGGEWATLFNQYLSAGGVAPVY